VGVAANFLLVSINNRRAMNCALLPLHIVWPMPAKAQL